MVSTISDPRLALIEPSISRSWSFSNDQLVDFEEIGARLLVSPSDGQTTFSFVIMLSIALVILAESTQWWGIHHRLLFTQINELIPRCRLPTLIATGTLTSPRRTLLRLSYHARIRRYYGNIYGSGVGRCSRGTARLSPHLR